MSNFSFLEEKFPVLANFGNLAEQYCYSDPNSSLLKSGMIGETIINLIFRYDNIPLPYDNTAVAKIDTVYREGLITRDLCDIFHTLRKLRNKAAHENYGAVEEAVMVLEMAYSICEWFMQTYGDWEYQNKPFVKPVAPQAVETVTEEIKKKEQSIEEKLVREAEAAAASAPKVDSRDRKERAKKAANQRPISEAETRILIDEQLRQVGWEADTSNLRHSKGTRPEKGRNMAIAEWPTDSTVGNHGFVDYALFIGTKMVGTIEAKAEHLDIPSVIDYQCKDYSRNIRQKDQDYVIDTWGEYSVPFTFATNGRPYLKQYEIKSGIWCQDLRLPYNTPKALHGWISPIGISELLAKDVKTGDERLLATPYDLLRDPDGLGLRDYQIKAVKAVEKAIVSGRQTALLAMATGTGKTRTILGMIYRFLQAERFRRILFLVDRTSLGEQAEDVFREVRLEDLKTLDNIYNIKNLEESGIDKETRVQVATVQSMVKRIMYNDGEKMPAVTDYDLIIIDEAHRGYILDKEMDETESLFRDQLDYQSKYRNVVEYFDAVKIAITATPALHTTEIFGPPVYTYTYAEAVIDGWLVDHDVPHDIHTKLRDEGIHYKKGDTVVIYDPVTGQITNSELLEDELDFDIENYNRQVVTESFNCAVFEEIAKDIDPSSPEIQGKTLIYAVDDQHADLIVKILKDIYSESGVDNDAIMKITGSVGGGNRKKIQEAIKRFKNERYPSVVVTVDLLTTGIDVPSISTLVFMRRIRSRILFEQMLGRATRLCPEISKTHFEIYDPVGVYESLADVNTMKPIVANPTTTFDELLDGLDEMDDERHMQYQIDQIIAKLQRRKRNMDEKTMEQFVSMTGGKDPSEIAVEIEHSDPESARERLRAYRNALAWLQQTKANGNRAVVISDEKDELTSHTRGYGQGSKPEDYLESFETFLKTHMNEIAALNVVCTRPRELTRESLKELRLTLEREGFTTTRLNTAVSQMTNEEMAADIVCLIRRYTIGSHLISQETRVKNAVDKLKAEHSFSKQELNWIDRIGAYLLNESVINASVFDEDSRFRAQGGYERINKAFRGQLDSVIAELNDYLYDDGGHVA